MHYHYFAIFLFLGTSAFSQSHNEATKPHVKKEEARVPIDVPPDQQAKIGLKVVKSEMKKLEHTIRTVGTVTADQTKESHVHTRINGWIEQIYADIF